MLGKRVVTALVLLAILVPPVFVFGTAVWGAVTLVFLGFAAHEWAKLFGENARYGMRPAWVAIALVLVGVALLAWREISGWPPAFVTVVCAAATLSWIVLGPWHLRVHDARGGGWALAAAWLLACWVALVALRAIGPLALFAGMAIVWIADIGAYFVGRNWGRRKLAPSISPGKSREGAAGGAVAVAVLGLAAAAVPSLSDTLPARLVDGWGMVGAVVVLVALVALSIVGDLHESLLKRQSGVKDSGTILPGHGGVLDRIDALIPVMPAVVLMHELLG